MVFQKVSIVILNFPSFLNKSNINSFQMCIAFTHEIVKIHTKNSENIAEMVRKVHTDLNHIGQPGVMKTSTWLSRTSHLKMLCFWMKIIPFETITRIEDFTSTFALRFALKFRSKCYELQLIGELNQIQSELTKKKSNRFFPAAQRSQ